VDTGGGDGIEIDQIDAARDFGFPIPVEAPFRG
jgi:hypothetical protein